MSTQTIETLSQRVIELAPDQVDIPIENITPDSQFIADLGFDSLDHVEFVMTIEEAFDVTVRDEEAEKIKTVRDAVGLIQTLISS